MLTDKDRQRHSQIKAWALGLRPRYKDQHEDLEKKFIIHEYCQHLLTQSSLILWAYGMAVQVPPISNSDTGHGGCQARIKKEVSWKNTKFTSATSDTGHGSRQERKENVLFSWKIMKITSSTSDSNPECRHFRATAGTGNGALM